MVCVVIVVVATDDYCLFQNGKRERKIRLLKLTEVLDFPKTAP